MFPRYKRPCLTQNQEANLKQKTTGTGFFPLLGAFAVLVISESAAFGALTGALAGCEKAESLPMLQFLSKYTDGLNQTTKSVESQARRIQKKYCYNGTPARNTGSLVREALLDMDKAQNYAIGRAAFVERMIREKLLPAMIRLEYHVCRQALSGLLDEDDQKISLLKDTVENSRKACSL
jgi:hypothetical protein